MPLCFRAVAAAAVFACLLPAADPQLISLVMPDAKVVGGLNMTEIRDTPFGQFLLGRMEASEKGFQEFMAATGFDLRRDLAEVVLASTGEPGEQRGLLLARGAFDTARIGALLRGAGKIPEIYRGVEIIGGRQQARVMAFLDGNTAVAGDLDTVKAAIDRRSQPTRLDAGLNGKIEGLRTSHHVWGVTVAPIANLSVSAPDAKMGGMMQGDLFKTIDAASAGLRFGDTVRLSAEAVARTEKDAIALADALKFLAGMAGMQSKRTEGIDFQALLKSLELTAESNTVRLALEMPEAEFENLIGPKHRPAPAQN